MQERELLALVYRVGHQIKCRQTVNGRTARIMLFTKSQLDTKAKVHFSSSRKRLQTNCDYVEHYNQHDCCMHVSDVTLLSSVSHWSNTCGDAPIRKD